jgi:methylthioribose-1-phosphate isomerase
MNDFDAFSLRFQRASGRGLELLDQRQLPDNEVWLDANSPSQMWHHIECLAVRGAPMIGVAAACCLAVHATSSAAPTREQVVQAADYLESSRPTAVNLRYCCDAVRAASTTDDSGDSGDDAAWRLRVVAVAQRLLDRETAMCDAMARHGAALVREGDGILTHCNTGSLAVPGCGTALGVIRLAHRQGKRIHVFVDETRPLLQGGRLTTYELRREGIPYTLIADNMAATLMRDGKIQRIFVGADRIAVNGDFANKIGTYTVAVLAKHHGIPFHAVAPASTIDPRCANGAAIPIEQRNADEVRGARGARWAPADAPVYNPAFDVTPMALVTSHILDTGVFDAAALAKLDGGFAAVHQ